MGSRRRPVPSGAAPPSTRRRTSTRTRRTRGARCARRSSRTWRCPRTRWCHRCRARSPSRPAGRTARCRPARICPTSRLTGGWRCEVPISCRPPATSASICSGRTFDGPHPNRPSPGSRSGWDDDGARLHPVSMPARPGFRTVCFVRPVASSGADSLQRTCGAGGGGFLARLVREPNLPPTRRDRPFSHPRRRLQGEGAPGRRRERDRVRRR